MHHKFGIYLTLSDRARVMRPTSVIRAEGLTHPRRPNVTPTLRPVGRGRLERAWLRWPGLGAHQVMTPIAQSVQRGSPPMHSAPHLPLDSVRPAVHHLRAPYHLPCRLLA